MTKSLPTLGQIKSLIQTEGKIIIAAFDRDMKQLECRMGSVEDRMGVVENRLGNIGTNLDNHTAQNEKDFDGLHEAIQEVMGGLDKSADQKIAKHCQEKHVFATS